MKNGKQKRFWRLSCNSICSLVEINRNDNQFGCAFPMYKKWHHKPRANIILIGCDITAVTWRCSEQVFFCLQRTHSSESFVGVFSGFEMRFHAAWITTRRHRFSILMQLTSNQRVIKLTVWIINSRSTQQDIIWFLLRKFLHYRVFITAWLEMWTAHIWMQQSSVIMSV
jgi:hypothetical protein